MAKIMRIVEPHMYQEFLLFLRKPSCSCKSSLNADGYEEETFPAVTVSQESQNVADQSTLAGIIIPNDDTRLNICQGDDHDVAPQEASAGDTIAIQKKEQHDHSPTEIIGNGRSTNWLNIEMLRLEPYKKKVKVGTVVKNKGGKRSKGR